MARTIHVAKNGSRQGDGSRQFPMLFIQQAADIAKPGDTVVVHEGTYREWVKPRNSGEPYARITYQAAEGEKVVIKGSEVVKDWVETEKGVWKTVVAESVFGEKNPFREKIYGDWLVYPKDFYRHTGAVYLNGKALFEAQSLEEVLNPVIRTTGVGPDWDVAPEAIPHPENTLLTWYADVKPGFTTIYINTGKINPNFATTEINVRECCFFPDRTGLNYISVRGFEFAQAASPWAPPTSFQPGMVGVNWSKGWIIENNILHDAKCSAISIGRWQGRGSNLCTKDHRKPGYQYQMEDVFDALRCGWSKETIGSHVIRNNKIYDCGQNGIVGHMGGIFSRIEHNEIWNIGVRHEFFGHEIAGIKLHAAIDAVLVNNYIHDCTLGTWLDWEAQGARVTRNVYLRNVRDLFIEVTHGPLIIDDNIFGSDYNLDNAAQGTAFIHNLFCGIQSRWGEEIRTTPYHYPHSTQIHGTAFTYSGDDRYFRNIFVGGQDIVDRKHFAGTGDYDGSPVSIEEYSQRVVAHGNEDLEMFVLEKEPVYIRENTYWGGAIPFDREKGAVCSTEIPDIKFVENNGHIWIQISNISKLPVTDGAILGTKDMEACRITEGRYEDREGIDIVFNEDITGGRRNGQAIAGPIKDLRPDTVSYIIY